MIVYNRNQYNKWILDQLASLDKFMSELIGETAGAISCLSWKRGIARAYRNFVISINDKGDTTIYNTKTGKSGKAHFNPNDDFDVDLGFALAWARYMKKEIPVVRTATKIGNLRVGDVVNFGNNDNFIVLSKVSNIKYKNDIALTLMSWNGNRDSFYHGTTTTVIKNQMALTDVVDHVNL